MKIVFSTKNVSRASFLDICRYAYDYGFEGFEIYDAVKERNGHHDSILRRDRIADAKRKLVNRNLSVSALRMPSPIDSDETTAELVEKYVDMAAASGIDNVIVSVESDSSFDILDSKMASAIKRAESSDVNILFETVGCLANTENIIIMDKPLMTGEDFAYFCKHAPSALVWYGAKCDNYDFPLHSANMVANEDAIEVSTRIFFEFAMNYLN